MKKTSEKKEDILRMEDNPEANKNSILVSKIKSIDLKGAQHSFLVLSEKLVRRSRMFFSKTESKFQNWGNTLRSKREISAERRNKKKEAGPVAQKEDDIMEKLRKYKLEKKNNPVREKIGMEIQKNIPEEEEKTFKPIISDRVVSPKSRAVVKDKLEELLIERIAVNPKDIEAYERLGEYYMEIENFNFAKECFKQIVKLDPTNRSVKYKMRKLEKLLTK